MELHYFFRQGCPGCENKAARAERIASVHGLEFKGYDLDTVDGLAEAAFESVPSGAQLPYLVLAEDGVTKFVSSSVLRIARELL